MGTSPIFLYTEYNDLGLDLSFVGGDPPVNPEVQRYQEALRKIDNLHEFREPPRVLGTDHHEEGPVCAECWNTWPCATHKIIQEVLP